MSADASNRSVIVTRCHDQLEAYLLSIAEFKKQVFSIYNIGELRDIMYGAKPPAAGVLYEGMRGGNKQTGLASSLTFSLLLLLNTERFGATRRNDGSTNRDKAIDLLDQIRDTVKATRAPSGHFWRFILEAPAVEQKGLVLWISRWQVPVILSQ